MKISPTNSFRSIMSGVLFVSSQTTLKSWIPLRACTSLKKGSTRFTNCDLVKASLNSNRVKKVIVLDTELNKSNKFNFLIEDIKKQNIEIEIVKDNKLWEFHSRHNIVGICEEKEIFDEKNFENIVSERILILDHIQDTNNLGAVARSAAAFDFQTIFLPKKRSVQITEKTFAISSGGMEFINIVMYNSIFSLIKKLQNLGFWIIGLDMNSSNEIKDLDLKNQNIALIVGSEGTGLSNEIQKKLDLIINISMTNNMESLNASVASAIAMHEIFIKK